MFSTLPHATLLLFTLISSLYAQDAVPGNFLISFRGRCNSKCEQDAVAELQRSSETSGCDIRPIEIRVGKLNIRSVICPPGVTGSTLSNAFSSFSKARGSIPRVADIEKNVIFKKQGFISSSNTLNTTGRQGEQVRWNIDEVDGGSPRDGIRTCSASTRGQGSHIWILDTGCQPTNGGECLGVFESNSGAPPCADVEGHGTHVAGSATHPEFGVAPNARRSCYKILDDTGSGDAEGIIRAILDVSAMKGKTPNGDIINMSLGGARSRTLDAVIGEVSSEGIYFSVAAGNEGANACKTSPARATLGNPNVYSVQAHDRRGRMADFSNFANQKGKNQCTDLSGPGVAVLSERLGGGTVDFDGTSMASPHVGGAIATLLGNGKAVNLENLIESGFVVTTTRRKAPAERSSVGLTC